MSSSPEREDVPGLVVVRGAGDLATGVLQKLVHAGFDVLALEVPHPMAIRWKAALCAAVRESSWQVEDLNGVLVRDWEEARTLLAHREASCQACTIPVLVDPEATVLDRIRPVALVDAVLAKRNIGTHRDMAPVTVGCGPGFAAGDDVDLVVETMRGHELGRVITEGPAIANTGVPGLIAGRAAERVLHAPVAGIVEVRRGIGSVVEEDEVVCVVHGENGPAPVTASLRGVVRGMIPNGYRARSRMKIADVDPREEVVGACATISDKARAVGAGALDAVLQGLVGNGSLRPRDWPVGGIR